jgi:hypothetical protein
MRCSTTVSGTARLPHVPGRACWCISASDARCALSSEETMEGDVHSVQTGSEGRGAGGGGGPPLVVLLCCCACRANMSVPCMTCTQAFLVESCFKPFTTTQCWPAGRSSAFTADSAFRHDVEQRRAMFQVHSGRVKRHGGQEGQRTSCDCIPSPDGFKNRSFCSSTKASVAVGRAEGHATKHAVLMRNSASFM